MKLKQLLFALILFTTPHGSLADNAKSHDTIQLSKQHKKSRLATVKVVTPEGHGTGTYVKIGESLFGTGGYLGVLTAAHVVQNRELVVIQSESQQTAAKVIWKDTEQDLAFLIVGKIENRKPLSVIGSPNIHAGDEFVYSGYPSTHDILTFSCNVANPDQDGSLITQCYGWFGASGSGFVNKDGKVFAVLSGVAVESFYGMPQVQETLIIGSVVKKNQIKEIVTILETLDY